MDKKNEDEINPGKFIGIALVTLIIVTLLLGSFYTIPAGYRGVLLTFGKPTMEVQGEGLHLKLPLIQKIIKMDTRTQKYEAELTAASQDLQDVNTKIAINYHIQPDQAATIYQGIGIDYSEKIVYPLEQEMNKGITAQYTAAELITKREEVREKMKNSLMEKLRPRGIIIEEVSIINFAFSDSYSQAIEAKVTAEQLKQKAEMDLQRIKVEAEQKIASATAEAESLRLQKQQITPDLIALRQIEVQRTAIEKWDGRLPTYTGGAVPFINLGTIQ